MTTINEKLVTLEGVQARVEAFVAQGGDVKFVNAFDAVAREFGYEILKPLKKIN